MQPIKPTLPPLPPPLPKPTPLPPPPLPTLPEKTKNQPGIYKYVFFISLIIFSIVVGSIVLTVINKPKASLAPPPSSFSPTPTGSIQPVCQLNDKEYQVGESFSTVDGCNTCTCQPNLTISCTSQNCSQ